MSAVWVWWVMAAVLIGVELLTGTYYLLAVGAAFALGGLAAWLGASLEWQLAIAGVLAVALTILAHQWRVRRGTPPTPPALDVGQSVRVEQWNPDGSARVAYRGSQWNAELASPETPRAPTMYVVATRGSTLVIADRKPT